MIINPYTLGYGDVFLGRKIKLLFDSQSYIVKHIVVAPKYLKCHQQKSLLVELFKPHNGSLITLVKKTERHIIYVAPANIFAEKNFFTLISYLKNIYNINTDSILCLNEMGVEYKISCNVFSLTYNVLGFASHQLGYIKTSTTVCNRINRIHNTLLSNLLDSLNMSISPNDHFFIAYLSESEIFEYTMNNISLFINNTQFEYPDSNVISN